MRQWCNTDLTGRGSQRFDGTRISRITGVAFRQATIDGTPLFDYQGPLRIVAPGDKRGARSVRMLERIDIVRLRK
jgi:hypothetical protein